MLTLSSRGGWTGSDFLVGAPLARGAGSCCSCSHGGLSAAASDPRDRRRGGGSLVKLRAALVHGAMPFAGVCVRACVCLTTQVCVDSGSSEVFSGPVAHPCAHCGSVLPPVLPARWEALGFCTRHYWESFLLWAVRAEAPPASRVHHYCSSQSTIIYSSPPAPYCCQHSKWFSKAHLCRLCCLVTCTYVLFLLSWKCAL